MITKSDFILNEALSMTPSERAKIAHCLIYSLEETNYENVDEQWIKLAEKRLAELKNGKVRPLTWEEIKKELVE